MFQRETKTKNLQLLKSKDNVDSRFSVTLKGDLNEKEFFTIRSHMKIFKRYLKLTLKLKDRCVNSMAITPPLLPCCYFLLLAMHTLQFCVKYFLNQRKGNGCLFLTLRQLDFKWYWTRFWCWSWEDRKLRRACYLQILPMAFGLQLE